ncbi:MAG: hypothetical protein HZB43_07720 [candidate division Zixibacteria bacterium]|nr:hypothetical protein [candidate division Zixibacteria bacterium]
MSQTRGAGFTLCDSATTAKYAKALFGEHEVEYHTFTITPHWRSHQETVYLIGSTFVGSPFQMSRLYWPSIQGTVDVVIYRTIDIKGLFEGWGAVYTTWTSGSNVAFIAHQGDSLVNVYSIDPKGTGLNASLASIQSMEWLKLGRDSDHVLGVTVHQSFGQVSGAGTDTRLEFWQQDAGKLNLEGEILLEEYQTSGGIYRFSGQTHFLDVDNDGEFEMLYRRAYSYGTSRRTKCTEACPTVWKLRDGKLGIFGMLMPDSLVVRTSANLPILVYPLWDAKSFPPKTSSDTFNVVTIEQLVRSKQSVNTHPPAVWSELGVAYSGGYREPEPGTGTTAIWLDSASLYIEVTVMDPEVNQVGPPYSVALWFDSAYPGGYSSALKPSNKGVMLFMWAEGKDTFAHADWYRLIGDSARLESAYGTLPARLRPGYGGYTFSCSIPRERIGFVPGDSIPAICGFLMEVFDRGTTEVSPRVTPSLTILGPGCHRLDPSTWFTLVEGIRKDTVYTR